MRLQASSRLERDLLRKRRSKEAGGRFFAQKKSKQSGLCFDVAPKARLRLALLACMLGFTNRAALYLRSWSLRYLTGSSPHNKNPKQKDTLWVSFCLAPQVGLEPTTTRLTVAGSTD